jgi:hypothetical protein
VLCGAAEDTGNGVLAAKACIAVTFPVSVSGDKLVPMAGPLGNPMMSSLEMEGLGAKTALLLVNPCMLLDSALPALVEFAPKAVIKEAACSSTMLGRRMPAFVTLAVEAEINGLKAGKLAATFKLYVPDIALEVHNLKRRGIAPQNTGRRTGLRRADRLSNASRGRRCCCIGTGSNGKRT